MFYTIYKITNKLNNKYYIGKHQTADLNDGYMGSGKLIRKAIEKYSVENFDKEILHVFDNEVDMNFKEKELVILSEQSYNLCDGGKGGFGFINKNIWTELKRLEHNKIVSPFGKEHSLTYKDKITAGGLKGLEKTEKLFKEGKINRKTFLGKSHSKETKDKMRKSKNVGINNSQFGTCWVTNGQENKKIKKEELDKFIELGYYKGRKISV